MPVFDFSKTTENKKEAECTYTTFQSDDSTATPEKPILLLDHQQKEWAHHSNGFFTNPNQRTAFEFEEEEGKPNADILQVDSRFVSLLRWLGEHHIHVQLSGKNTEKGYAVYNRIPFYA